MYVRTKERVFPAENASDLHEDLPPKKKKKLVGRSEKFGRALTINNQFFLHSLIAVNYNADAWGRDPARARPPESRPPRPGSFENWSHIWISHVAAASCMHAVLFSNFWGTAYMESAFPSKIPNFHLILTFGGALQLS